MPRHRPRAIIAHPYVHTISLVHTWQLARACRQTQIQGQAAAQTNPNLRVRTGWLCIRAISTTTIAPVGCILNPIYFINPDLQPPPPPRNVIHPRPPFKCHPQRPFPPQPPAPSTTRHSPRSHQLPPARHRLHHHAQQRTLADLILSAD